MMDVLKVFTAGWLSRAIHLLDMGAVALALLPSVAMAEGSKHLEFTQRLLDFQASRAPTGNGIAVYAIDDNSASLFVDVIADDEIINISLCGTQNSDDVSVELFDPSGNSVFTDNDNRGNNNLDAPLPITGSLVPFRYTAPAVGTYRIVVQNETGSNFGDSYFERYDIAVTQTP